MRLERVITIPITEIIRDWNCQTAMMECIYEVDGVLRSLMRKNSAEQLGTE